jgi:type VI secretion system protein VasD
LASIAVTAAALLSGCGMWQSVKETTVDATRAVFIAKVKQMNLVIESRAALNQNDAGQSLPVVLHIYQLKDAKAFEKASYAQLLEAGRDVLKDDIPTRTEVTLGPSATVNLSESVADESQYVGVVSFFQDQANAEWHVLIPKSQWKKTDPVRLVVSGNRVEMEPVR